VLDATRYDNFCKANTPNMDSIGEAKKTYTSCSWTLPSMFSLLVVPSHIGHSDMLPFSAPNCFWVPECFQNEGYWTMFLSANDWIGMHEEVFNRNFSFFNIYDKHSLIKMIENCQMFLNETPYFIVLHVMETHFPYYDGKRTYPRNPLTNQIKAIEYVDKQLGVLFKDLKNTQVIITADHGTTGKGHSPKYVKVFSKELFEVPLIEGYVK